MAKKTLEEMLQKNTARPDALETANTVPADLIGVVDANTDKIAVSVAEPSVAEPSNDDPVAAASQTEERGRS